MDTSFSLSDQQQVPVLFLLALGNWTSAGLTGENTEIYPMHSENTVWFGFS